MWIDAEKGNLSEGTTRLKWPDGFVSMERLKKVDGKLCIMTSHRGLDFAAPLAGSGMQTDDGKAEAPPPEAEPKIPEPAAAIVPGAPPVPMPGAPESPAQRVPIQKCAR